jgi:hypothetical protein
LVEGEKEDFNLALCNFEFPLPLSKLLGRNLPETQEKMCGLGTYYDRLDLAFQNATKGAGETLVTVQVLPSLHREYALALKRVGQKSSCCAPRSKNNFGLNSGRPKRSEDSATMSRT